MSDLPKSPWVLVRGVVYRQTTWVLRTGRIVTDWRRRSVPPDANPAKRSKWPPAYREERLPDHEVIDEASALVIIKDAGAVFMARLRSKADPAMTPTTERP